jgi:hypothetical protein
MILRPWVISSCALLANVWAVQGAAQAAARDSTADSLRTRLAPITVLARGSDRTTINVPLAITVIDREDLHRTRGYGLDEALSHVPGVLAQSRSGASDVRIVIRGFGARGRGSLERRASRGIRVLLDGFPRPNRTVAPRSTGSTSGSRADRRGPVNASALWGMRLGVVAVSTVRLLTQWDVSRTCTGATASPYRAQGGTEGAGRVFSRSSIRPSTAIACRRKRDADCSTSGTATSATNRPGRVCDGVEQQVQHSRPLTRAEAEADPEQANATYASRRERGTIAWDVSVRRSRIGSAALMKSAACCT